MPTTDDHFLVGIEINCLVGPASDISKHRDLLSSHGKVGNGCRSANVDSHLPDMDQTGKLPLPTAILCIEIGCVAIRTSIDHVNPLGKVFHFLEAANWTKNFFLKDTHLGFSLKNGWTEKIPFGIFLNPGISPIKNQFCPILNSPIHF